MGSRALLLPLSVVCFSIRHSQLLPVQLALERTLSSLARFPWELTVAAALWGTIYSVRCWPASRVIAMAGATA